MLVTGKQDLLALRVALVIGIQVDNRACTEEKDRLVCELGENRLLFGFSVKFLPVIHLALELEPALALAGLEGVAEARVAKPVEVAADRLYQGALIMTHRDGFPRFSARSAWRGDAGHREPGDAARKPWAAVVPVAWANRRRASGSLDDAPHRLRPPFCPADRPRDLYGSLISAPWY